MFEVPTTQHILPPLVGRLYALCERYLQCSSRGRALRRRGTPHILLPLYSTVLANQPRDWTRAIFLTRAASAVTWLRHPIDASWVELCAHNTRMPRWCLHPHAAYRKRIWKMQGWSEWQKGKRFSIFRVTHCCHMLAKQALKRKRSRVSSLEVLPRHTMWIIDPLSSRCAPIFSAQTRPSTMLRSTIARRGSPRGVLQNSPRWLTLLNQIWLMHMSSTSLDTTVTAKFKFYSYTAVLFYYSHTLPNDAHTLLYSPPLSHCMGPKWPRAKTCCTERSIQLLEAQLRNCSLHRQFVSSQQTQHVIVAFSEPTALSPNFRVVSCE